MADYTDNGLMQPGQERYVIQAFKGIDDHERIADGSWQEMLNLTAEEYPAAKTRRARKVAQYLVNDRTPLLIGEPVDAVSVDGVMVTACEGGIITYGDRIMPTGAGIRHIAMMGRKIFCDNGILIDPATDEVEKTWQLIWYDGGSYTVQMVDAGGASITVHQTEPNPPSDGDYWYDSVRDGLYQWSEGQQEWIAIPTMYTKITLPDPTLMTPPNNTDLSGLKAGDVVEATIERYKSTYVVHSVDNTNNAIILRGLLYPTPAPPLTVGVTIERKMPVLDFVCEHDNRIWGCRYGINGVGEDAEFVNEIYCCALGDPMNWYLYEGTAADSWTASVGAPGKWTGIRECGEYLVFFKEDRYYILSGSAPGSYRLTEFEADGVMDGCDRSIQNIGGSLYYKSVHGIRRLTPYGYPQDISDALNTDRWTDAIAGTDGRRYYIQMARGAEKDLYVLDTETGYWTREDAPENLKLMLRWKNEVMAVCAEEGSQFAYVTYDREGSAAAMPKRSDYNTYADYLMAYFAWLTKDVLSRAWAGLTVLELITTCSATSFDDLEDKADAKITSGHFLKKHNFWTVDYILMRNAGREMPVPPGYTVEPDEDTLTELTGVWEDEPDAQWYGVTGLMGLNLPDEKRVRVIQLRIKTEAKTRMSVKIQTDESGRWTEVWSANTGRSGTHRIAYTPAARNDTFRFRLEGTGPMVLYSITYQLEQGGDMNVPEHTKT